MNPARTFGSSFFIVALSLSAWLSSGCSDDAFCFDCKPNSGNGGSSEGGSGGSGGNAGNAGVGLGGAIAGTAGSAGNIAGTAGTGGQNCDTDVQTDPLNCGMCGHVCDVFGAFPKCEMGECKISECAPGHYNINATDSDGCEYVCTPSVDPTEICDEKDNDCDGTIDNGVDKDHDANNCGACGNVCALANATAKCEPVLGVGTCVIESCADGFNDVDKLDTTGCEYSCPVFPPVDEECNALDDDCDGVINNGNPGGGASCAETCPNGVCQGQCTPGTTTCVGTEVICVAGQGPSIEVCDMADNNCDGQVDEGFDTDTDPLNCGGCGIVCEYTNGLGQCVGGNCQFVDCLPGFANNDISLLNGCEYTCPVYPTSIETCNGLDDDCNGVADDAMAIAAQKPAQSLCKPSNTMQPTPCDGVDFVCMGPLGWRCDYPADVELQANGTIAIVESKCDGKDGNCNGQVDEAFPDVGAECDNGQKGACKDTGVRKCDPNDDSTTICDLSVLPDPIPGAPFATESCNGIDDDCNGQVDDGIVDDMVHITANGHDFYIDRYEASRPGATDSDAGLIESRRCVESEVLPWTQASFAEAAAACAATGARLCTDVEFQAACAGAGNLAYPYGNTYNGNTCNGLDFDGLNGGSDDNVLLPTGDAALAGCETADGVADLSGNVAEWTSTVTGTTSPGGLNIYMVKGGSYQSPSLGLSCQFTLSRFASNAILADLGFRCCKDGP